MSIKKLFKLVEDLAPAKAPKSVQEPVVAESTAGPIEPGEHELHFSHDMDHFDFLDVKHHLENNVGNGVSINKSGAGITPGTNYYKVKSPHHMLQMTKNALAQHGISSYEHFTPSDNEMNNVVRAKASQNHEEGEHELHFQAPSGTVLNTIHGAIGSNFKMTSKNVGDSVDQYEVKVPHTHLDKALNALKSNGVQKITHNTPSMVKEFDQLNSLVSNQHQPGTHQIHWNGGMAPHNIEDMQSDLNDLTNSSAHHVHYKSGNTMNHVVYVPHDHVDKTKKIIGAYTGKEPYQLDHMTPSQVQTYGFPHGTPLDHQKGMAGWLHTKGLSDLGYHDYEKGPDGLSVNALNDGDKLSNKLHSLDIGHTMTSKFTAHIPNHVLAAHYNGMTKGHEHLDPGSANLVGASDDDWIPDNSFEEPKESKLTTHYRMSKSELGTMTPEDHVAVNSHVGNHKYVGVNDSGDHVFQIDHGEHDQDQVHNFLTKYAGKNNGDWQTLSKGDPHNLLYPNHTPLQDLSKHTHTTYYTQEKHGDPYKHEALAQSMLSSSLTEYMGKNSAGNHVFKVKHSADDLRGVKNFANAHSGNPQTLAGNNDQIPGMLNGNHKVFSKPIKPEQLDHEPEHVATAKAFLQKHVNNYAGNEDYEVNHDGAGGLKITHKLGGDADYVVSPIHDLGLSSHYQVKNNYKNVFISPEGTKKAADKAKAYASTPKDQYHSVQFTLNGGKDSTDDTAMQIAKKYGTEFSHVDSHNSDHTYQMKVHPLDVQAAKDHISYNHVDSSDEYAVQSAAPGESFKEKPKAMSNKEVMDHSDQIKHHLDQLKALLGHEGFQQSVKSLGGGHISNVKNTISNLDYVHKSWGTAHEKIGIDAGPPIFKHRKRFKTGINVHQDDSPVLESAFKNAGLDYDLLKHDKGHRFGFKNVETAMKAGSVAQAIHSFMPPKQYSVDQEEH